MSEPMVTLIDQLKGEYGARSRGRVLEMLLQDLLDPGDGSPDPEETHEKGESIPAATSSRCDEITSLVLIGPGSKPNTVEEAPASQAGGVTPSGSSGIDLPGFVSKRTSQLKATLQSPQHRDSGQNDPLVSTVDPGDLRKASSAAEDHWRSLYGQPPGPTVIEAAMTWLARDVWSSTDASDGRPFTWSAANAAVETLCAGWDPLDPSLGRVMAVAGALEDPKRRGTEGGPCGSRRRSAKTTSARDSVRGGAGWDAATCKVTYSLGPAVYRHVLSPQAAAVNICQEAVSDRI